MDTQASQGPGATKERKYLWLLLSLVAVALLLPIHHELKIAKLISGSSHLLGILFVGVMIFGVHTVSGHRLLRMVGTGLWVGALIAFAIKTSAFPHDSEGEHLARTVFYGFLLAGLVMLTMLILVDLFREAGVSHDRLRGAACAYLLMGLAWALAYSIIDVWLPGSFVLSEHLEKFVDVSTKDPGRTNELGHLTYYSYVTLTTVGYGDITPARPFAATFAWLEGFVGQFYLTVLVAFLVGKRLAAWMAENAS